VSALARRAADELGLPTPVLVRMGMNASFVAGDVVLRVSHANADVALSVALARLLENHGVRVPRPAAPGAVAVEGDLSVSAWERIVATGGEPVDWRGVGAMVARVHRIEPSALPPGLPLPNPSALPWWDFDRMLADVDDLLDLPARDGLVAAIERHRGWRESARTGAVVCHGDVHPGNVIQAADGPVLLDWDLLCLAAWGWDHAPLVMWAPRWGGDPHVYDEFAAGYGRDGRDDAFTVAVAELRLVAATLMRVRAGRADPAAAEEAARRLAHWRGDPDAPPWRAQ
jgi:Ser/Thr protein kinase RdoA (MazF antagonist)